MDEQRDEQSALHGATFARVTAVILVVTGTALVGFTPEHWDVVVVTLSRGHGIHLNDVAGTVLIGLGTLLLWTSPPRRA